MTIFADSIFIYQWLYENSWHELTHIPSWSS